MREDFDSNLVKGITAQGRRDSYLHEPSDQKP
ncbi:Uncharacterised protein [Chryseobacterium indoltheticum]|uniref:Uncharacterized protein n=1 Tax=Chryseobacterium indoltheticum TaxID=254 RepID=A0A381FMD1_9FLAO|nr:Uncharacterised protein [Chryseobacterium indoltheticum]